MGCEVKNDCKPHALDTLNETHLQKYCNDNPEGCPHYNPLKEESLPDKEETDVNSYVLQNLL